MKREYLMVAEYHYSTQQPVQIEPLLEPIPTSLIEDRFCLLFAQISSTHKAHNLSDIACGLGNTIYSSLSASLYLGSEPYPGFRSLNGLLKKVEQSMRVKGHEVNYIPVVTRNQRSCELYIHRLVKSTARFAYFNRADILTTALEHIICIACEFSLYLGIPLSDVFDEIHTSKLSSTRPDLDPVIYKTIPQ